LTGTALILAITSDANRVLVSLFAQLELFVNRYFQALQGFNFAALQRGFRDGPRTLARASWAAYVAARSAANRQQAIVRRELNQIPIVALTDFVGGAECHINLRVMRYEDGMLPYRDALALLTIIVAEQPREVLEIGTYMGHTTRAMAENLDRSIIHTIDLPPEFSAENHASNFQPKDDYHLIAKRVVGREFEGRQFGTRIVQHLCDTAVMDFARIGRPTFFFIDGSHTYEYCKNDSEKCLALCPTGGTFLWHDCDEMHPGVVQFLSEWRTQGRDVVRIADTALAYYKS
jgi:hypothetical protein